jgi:hypothetical protein
MRSRSCDATTSTTSAGSAFRRLPPRGTGVLAYLAAWAIIPAEGEKASIAEDLLSKPRHDSPG